VSFLILEYWQKSFMF